MIENLNALNNYAIDMGLKKETADVAEKANDGIFEAMLSSAKDILQATNQAEYETTQLTNDFMTGKNEDVHSLLIAQEKSSILLNFTLQVRNQVLTAYDEIMRIPV